MGPIEIRHRSREEHRRIGERLDRLDVCARTVAGAGEPPARASRRANELERALAGLLEELERHLSWEEELLPEALVAADAWGTERAERIRSAHLELREVMGFCRASCRSSARPLVLARRARELAHLVRGSLRREERDAVRSEVLREDVVAIDTVSS